MKVLGKTQADAGTGLVKWLRLEQPNTPDNLVTAQTVNTTFNMYLAGGERGKWGLPVCWPSPGRDEMCKTRRWH